MRFTYLPCLVLFFLTVAPSPLSAQLKKVRFSVSAISIAEIPFKIAQVKGFYLEEGLNVEAILEEPGGRRERGCFQSSL